MQHLIPRKAETKRDREKNNYMGIKRIQSYKPKTLGLSGHNLQNMSIVLFSSFFSLLRGTAKWPTVIALKQCMLGALTVTEKE